MRAMAYFFDAFPFEPGSRLTGVWTARVDIDADAELVAMASLMRLGRDQHDVVESNFLGAHMPYHFGGFHGMGPDGHPWAMMLQVAPVSAAALVGAECFWPMTDGLDRAWHYNWEADCLHDQGFDRDQLVSIYAFSGVDASAIEDWGVAELMLGLLAQCCYVPLPQIVAGRIVQCAFPDVEHECQHDVFSDVFARWGAGQLSPPEPPVEPAQVPRRRAKKLAPGRPPEYWWPKKRLRELSTKKLRNLALRGYWDEREIKGLSRKELIKKLSTPHWKNESEGANVIVYPDSGRRGD